MSWNKSVVIDRHACAYSIEIDYSQSLLPSKLDSIASLYELIIQLIILFPPSFGLDVSFIFYKSKPLKKCIYFLLMEIDVEWNNYHWIYQSERSIALFVLTLAKYSSKAQYIKRKMQKCMNNFAVTTSFLIWQRLWKTLNSLLIERSQRTRYAKMIWQLIRVEPETENVFEIYGNHDFQSGR